MRAILLLATILLLGACATNIKKGSSTTAEPVKELTKKNIVGTYEYKAFESAYTKKFLGNGVVEDYEGVEKKAGRTWKLVDGEIHKTNSFGSFTVYRINSDDSITRIAIIKEFLRGKERTNYGKEFQWTFKKIK